MKKRDIFALALGFDVVAFDYLTKWIAATQLTETIVIIPDWLAFELQKNPHLAFSIPFPNVMQIVLSLGLMVLLVLYWKQNDRSGYEHFALASIFGGAVGNLSERILFKEVTDFIAVGNFPVFNLADIAITLGVVVLLWSELFAKKSAPPSNPEADHLS